MKKIFFLIIFTFLFSVAISAYAGEFILSFPDFSTATNPGQFVIVVYNYALGISGTLAVIMIVYGGLKYLSSPGNPSALTDAKDIIFNAVFGIIILFGAFMILNTINPALTQVKQQIGSLGPIPPAPSQEPIVSPAPINSNQVTIAARKLLWASNVSYSQLDECKKGADPKSIIDAVANSDFPIVCTSTCECKKGGSSGNITLSYDMLDSLAEIALGNNASFRITSLTGDKHAAGSLHYQGRGVDITIVGGVDVRDPNQWTKLVGELNARKAIANCEVGGHFVDCKDLFNADGSKKEGAHIDAKW